MYTKMVFEKSWEKGKYEFHCKRKDDGTAYCEVEEKNGEKWGKIIKVPDEKGNLKTDDISGSSDKMGKVAQKVAADFLSSRSKPR